MQPSENQSQLIHGELPVVRNPGRPMPERKRKGGSKKKSSTQSSQIPAQSDEKKPTPNAPADDEFVTFVSGDMEYPVRKTTLAALKSAGWSTQEPMAVKPAKLSKTQGSKAAQAQAELLGSNGHSKADNANIYGGNGAGAKHLQSWASSYAQHLKRELGGSDSIALCFREGEDPRVHLAIVTDS